MDGWKFVVLQWLWKEKSKTSDGEPQENPMCQQMMAFSVCWLSRKTNKKNSGQVWFSSDCIWWISPFLTPTWQCSEHPYFGSRFCGLKLFVSGQNAKTSSKLCVFINSYSILYKYINILLYHHRYNMCGCGLKATTERHNRYCLVPLNLGQEKTWNLLNY